MIAHAQTNLQLFNQLAQRGYAPEEIARVRDAYALAIRLFTGLYRPSGKTFVAHVVGTASACVEFGAPVTLVGAALLHAAYASGDFGSMRKRVNDRKRNVVRAAIGEEGEALVAAYTALEWNERTIRELCERESACAGRERDVALLRLANEVDEYADLGALHTASWGRRVADARSVLPLCATLAERLGEPSLAGRLRAVAEETLAVDGPKPLAVAGRASTLVAPLSYRRLPHLAAIGFATRTRAAALRSLHRLRMPR